MLNCVLLQFLLFENYIVHRYARWNKREYAQANKEWLANKAREEGVKPLPKGIYYKVLAEGRADGKHPRPQSIVTAHYSGRTIDGNRLTAVVAVFPLLSASVILSRVGLSPCNRCV